MQQARSALCASKKAFLKRGWVPTERGLWRRVNTTEAYVNIYPNIAEDGETVYEFSIVDQKGISWQKSRKLLKEMEDLLPVETLLDTSDTALRV